MTAWPTCCAPPVSIWMTAWSCPPKEGKEQVMALVGKAGSGKTLLLAELYKALQKAGVEIVSGDLRKPQTQGQANPGHSGPDQQGRERAADARRACDDHPPHPLHAGL